MPTSSSHPISHRQLRPAGRRHRRGSIKGGLLVFMLGGGFLGATAIAVRPRPIGASVSLETVVGAERAMAAETLADLIRRCADVLAVHRRGDAPFTDIVLQAFDGGRPGAVEPAEVLVLTHSRTLRAVMAFTVDPSRRSQAGADPWPLDRAVIDAPDFARSWRDRPDVRRDLIPAGTGLVDLELIPAEGPGNEDAGAWTLRLTWADGSADGSVTVEVRVDPAVRDR